MVDTLNTKVEFLFTRVSDAKNVNKKMAEPSRKPIDDKVIADLNE